MVRLAWLTMPDATAVVALRAGKLGIHETQPLDLLPVLERCRGAIVTVHGKQHASLSMFPAAGSKPRPGDADRPVQYMFVTICSGGKHH